MNNSSAADYLGTLAQRPRSRKRTEPRDGLHALLARMGHPEQQLRCVHIAGSKGKGSTALMLDAMLRAAGRRTGVFTSPHIERWNERIRINGQPVDDAPLSWILNELRQHIQSFHEQGIRGPDFFEVLLVAALCLFKRAGVDEAIIEAGIGARFDATNVVQPLVSALVSVELEHTRLLGSSLAAIADDKADVARPGIPLIIGTLPAEAYRVVCDRAAQTGAPLRQPVIGYKPGSTTVMVDHRFKLPLPAPSRAQAVCAAVALGCLRALHVADQPETAAQHGMQTVVLPGRLEVLAEQPMIVADAAHTPASMHALNEALDTWNAATVALLLVLSCSGERDPRTLLAPLLPHTNHIIVTRADNTRSNDPEVLADRLRSAGVAGATIEVIEPVVEALQTARAKTPTNGIICATGSVYMAGAARQCFTTLKNPP